MMQRQVMAYFDRGTKIAQAVSADPDDTDLGDPVPTPRWGGKGLS
ncbi:hypothetical protein ACGF8D_26485 [Streptomyces massasporeus]